MRLPLFPLPNVLLYPGAVLPLHVFEPRFVQLVEDLRASDDDRLALALLKPGWKDSYFDAPPIHAVGGVGRLTSVQRAQDGRYNVLVEGIGRARLAEEPSKRLYRTVTAEMLPEPPADDEALKEQLRTALSDWSEDTVQAHPQRGVSYLADVLLLTLGVPIDEKQRIFEILDPAARARAVLGHYRAAQQLSQRLDAMRGADGAGRAELN